MDKIKKISIYVISTFLIFSLFFGAGFFTAYKTIKPETVEITKQVEVIKRVDKIVYRDYENVSYSDCLIALEKYDTEPMVIDYEINKLNKKYTDMNVNWKLYARQGSENIKVPVYESGNFKFYFGLSVGVLATAGTGYLVYNAIK